MWAGGREATRGAQNPRAAPLQGRQSRWGSTYHSRQRKVWGAHLVRNRDLRPGPGNPDPTVPPLGCPGLRWGRGRIWKGRWETRPVTPLAPPDLPTLCRCKKLRGHQLPCHGQLLILSSVRLNPKASTCSPGGCLKSWCLGAQTGGSGPRPCVFVGHHCPLTVVPHRRACPITKHCFSSDRGCERPLSGWLKQQVYLLDLEA